MKDTLNRKKKLLKELIDQEENMEVLENLEAILDPSSSIPAPVLEAIEISRRSKVYIPHTSVRDFQRKG